MVMAPTCATFQSYGTQMLLMHSKKNKIHALDVRPEKTETHGGASDRQELLLLFSHIN